MTEPTTLQPEQKALLRLCCEALEEKKADNLSVIDVSEQSSITNFMVLASANSQPHLKALKRELGKSLKSEKVGIIGVDEGEDSGWSVVDAFDVMIHLFTPEMRETYDLESLWKDGRSVGLEEIHDR